MKRAIVCALALLLSFLFGSTAAGALVVVEQVGLTHAKKQCKKVHGKCVKQKAKRPKAHVKKKPKPLTPVLPSIERGYRPPFFTTSPRMQLAVLAYKQCMYDDVPPGLGAIERALALNLVYRADRNLAGSAEKIGREVCLADALGLKRYETQDDIDRAKNTELFAVSPQFIEFPDDEGNRLPSERRFARAWVKAYTEALAYDLHTYLLAHRASGALDGIPLLRVNSLVRSLRDQSAQYSPAKCKNEICSTHLTGSTVDIANGEGRVSGDVRQWIRARLLQDRKDGKIVMIQEFARPHYHIFVIPPEYVEWYKERSSGSGDTGVR